MVDALTASLERPTRRPRLTQKLPSLLTFTSLCHSRPCGGGANFPQARPSTYGTLRRPPQSQVRRRQDTTRYPPTVSTSHYAARIHFVLAGIARFFYFARTSPSVRPRPQAASSSAHSSVAGRPRRGRGKTKRRFAATSVARKLPPQPARRPTSRRPRLSSPDRKRLGSTSHCDVIPARSTSPKPPASCRRDRPPCLSEEAVTERRRGRSHRGRSGSRAPASHCRAAALRSIMDDSAIRGFFHVRVDYAV